MANGDASEKLRKELRESGRSAAFERELRELARFIEIGEKGALRFTDEGKKRAQEGFLPIGSRLEAQRRAPDVDALVAQFPGQADAIRALARVGEAASGANLEKSRVRVTTPEDLLTGFALATNEFPETRKRLQQVGQSAPDFVNGPEFFLQTFIPQGSSSLQAKRQVLIELGRTREESSPQQIRSSAIRRRRQTILAPDTPTSSSFGLGQPTILGN